MTDAAPIDPTPPATDGAEAGLPVLERARGRAEIGFVHRDGATRLDRLFQEGQAKIRLPKPQGNEPPTAVTINTGGGIAGGDRIGWRVDWGAGTRATVTSQAAERVYRSSTTDGSLPGRIETRLTVGAGAVGEWLPQETILFDRAALDRGLEVEAAADARLLLCEAITLGRGAMGEAVTACRLADRWRIRRDGRPIFADTFRLDGDPREILAGPATGAGARAFATLILLAPDAEARIDAVRDGFDGYEGAAGASAFDGLIVARLADRDPRRLRDGLVRLLLHIRQAELPRVWSC